MKKYIAFLFVFLLVSYSTAQTSLTEIEIFFQVDMELEIVTEHYDTDSTVTARGSFNSWSDITELSPSAIDPNLYEGSTKYHTFEGDIIYYKFAFDGYLETIWETGDNREYVITADDIANGYSIVPKYIFDQRDNDIPLHSIRIKFIVDMNNALDADDTPFPIIENVVICGANVPFQWPIGGWPDSDSNHVVFMYDDGTNGDVLANDNFWTKIIDFPVYSPLSIEYKYGSNWGLASNNGTNENEARSGRNHFLVLLPGLWSGETIDIFGEMRTKDVLNSVEQVGDKLPYNFKLAQNYPNPFNPSTIISFSIPESGFITLKVYNLLGQEVVELVNEEKSAGTYKVQFDASSLTSGIYLYKIQSGNFASTKKMVLLR